MQSVFSRGKSGKPVSICAKAGMKSARVLCVKQGQKLNLKDAGTFVRSHTWWC